MDAFCPGLNRADEVSETIWIPAITIFTVEGDTVDVNKYRIVYVAPGRDKSLQGRDIVVAVIENSLVDKTDNLSVSLSRRNF